MDPSVSGSALAALGEDLFLLSVRRRDGKLLTRGRIDSALMASELIRLAAAGRAWIAEGRILARDQTATGDPELDAALRSLAGAASPPRPETWVGLPRRGIRAAYAARLASAGTLRLEPSRVLGTRRLHVGPPRYHVTDTSRVAVARSRLDAATEPAGPLRRRAALSWAAGLRVAGHRLAGRPRPGGPGRPGQRDRAGRGDLPRPGGAGLTGQDGSDRPAAGHLPGRGGRGAGTGQVPPGPASPLAMEGVIAATVHALTAVIEDGSIVASEVVGTRVGGIHLPGAQDAAGHGGEGHHAGTHRD